MEVSKKKIKEDDVSFNLEDDSGAFDNPAFRQSEPAEDQGSFSEAGGADEKLSSLYQLLGKQQQQRSDLQTKMNQSGDSGDGADSELLMSLEIQQEILEEKIAETLRNIQEATRELELFKEQQQEEERRIATEFREMNQKSAESTSAGGIDEPDGGLDELLSEIAETGVETLEEVEELFSEVADELLPEEPALESKAGEMEIVEELVEAEDMLEAGPGPVERPAAQTQIPGTPTPPSAPAPGIPQPVEGTKPVRPKLSRTLLSEIQEVSSTRPSVREVKREARQRSRRRLETTSLDPSSRSKRKRLKADMLKSATVLSFKKCVKCEAVVPANFKICGRCGEMLRSLCPVCGAHIPRGVEYCSSCNKRVLF